ncbi:bifunctional pyr operon transcriptional regulator/uracil phosphoribosyltransferase PyrR [candidate division KSB1 bacterium]|nr:bifunctional pyr operon transcriptional regulator/uracil phosphoribosyltransferase PyrR [candidate division KSB1 bacterium]
MEKQKHLAEIINANGMQRTLKRLASEIVEQSGGAENLVFVGLHTRGYPIAVRLKEFIKKEEKIDVPLGRLDVTMYRDDIHHRAESLEMQVTEVPVDIDGKTVILVDDVLFTGRTIRAAMDALIDMGRPAVIRLAVMVDRGHRELPIKADFIGKYLPTSRGEEVSVKLKNIDGVDGVHLIATDD